MFDIGDRVACVVEITDAVIAEFHREFPDYPLEQWPIKGCVYTIRGINKKNDELFFWLEEVSNPLEPGGEVTFCSGYFRPVRKTSIEVFTEILAPSDREREVA